MNAAMHKSCKSITRDAQKVFYFAFILFLFKDFHTATFTCEMKTGAVQ